MNEPSRVCAYDNPATMARECWHNGVRMCSYRYDVLAPFAKEPIPGNSFFFGANIGPWKSGQIVGDKMAIDPSAPGVHL